MQVGVVLPQVEMGDDPAILREYVVTAESLGYEHVLAYDHVLGVHPDREGWDGPYDYTDQFHEPFTLFGYFAAATDQINFVTGILVLPQRQTPLVAKQAAEVDVLSNGRLRLGVGIGWNNPEYVALDEDFSNRGYRIEEQITVLRDLWTNPLVDYQGDYHSIPNAGINPLPVQQPIPVWMGGSADPVLRRTARLADGWIPRTTPQTSLTDQLDRLMTHAREVDRDPADIGIHGRFRAVSGQPDDWIDQATKWNEIGADYLGINTMYQELSPSEHIKQIRTVATTLSDAGFM